MDSKTMTKKEYLKKYLGGGEKKKKKKKPVQSLIIKSKIVDDDIDLKSMKPVDEDELDIYDLAEEAPQIVGIIDERPDDVRLMSEFRSSKKWKIVADGIEDVKITSVDYRKTDEESSRVEKEISVQITENEDKSKSDSGESPHRTTKATGDENNSEVIKNLKKNVDSNSLPSSKKKNDSDSDSSPPRNKNNLKHAVDPEIIKNIKQEIDSDSSPPRRKKGVDSDSSPPRRKKKGNDSDSSPPRKKKRGSDSDFSPPRKKKRGSDSDSSPRRRRRKSNDGNFSPPRRKKRGSDSDSSPPRTKKATRHGVNSEISKHIKKEIDSDSSPPRKKKGGDLDSSPPRKAVKTGLQSAEEMRKESERRRQKEKEMFEKMSDEVTGRHAAAVVRNKKTGRRHDTKEEARKKREEEEKKAEKIAQYAVWGKGVKQVQDRQDKIKDDLYEMSKPLARYKDDEDLNEMLKHQEREGDPMLEYIRKKKKTESAKSSKPEYEGLYLPNRYGIKPGHKWDGVDRSNGYEKKWFEEQSAKKAREEEAFKWSTYDM